MTIFYTILLILAGLIIIFAADRDAFWQRLSGPPDLGQVNFAELERGANPNEALLCSAGFCPNYEKASPAPAYNSDADTLINKLNERLAKLESITRVDDGSDPRRLRYVAYSRLMRFPDTVNIQAFDLEPVNGKPRSGIAIFGKAKLGQSDMGVNRERVNGWLEMLGDLRAD